MVLARKAEVLIEVLFDEAAAAEIYSHSLDNVFPVVVFAPKAEVPIAVLVAPVVLASRL